jgi:hypothetical protein
MTGLRTIPAKSELISTGWAKLARLLSYKLPLPTYIALRRFVPLAVKASA